MSPRHPNPLRLTTGLALALVLAACARDRHPTDETGAPVPPVGFACVGNVDELANDPLHPAGPPACRVGTLAAVTVDGKPVPGVMVVEHGPTCAHAADGYVVDLAPAVVQRLYGRYQSEPTFVPLQDSPACPAATMQPVGGATSRLEITTTATAPATGPNGENYLFSATVTAKLVETATGRVLWQDSCRPDLVELKAAATFPDPGNLRRVLAGEAERCAAGFGGALGAPVPL